MTHLRRLLLVLVTGCVALAVGIALGAGPLQGESDDDSAAVAADRDRLAARVTALEDARVFDEAVGRAALPGLVGQRLTGRTVTVLALPGTSEDTLWATRTAVKAAGASVVVTAQLAPDLVDPAKKTYVDSVATNSVSGEPALAEIVTGETYDRIGALIARAYVGSGDSTAFDETATSIDSELQGAKLLTVEGRPGRRGSLVVLVGPAEDDDAATIEAQHVIQTALVRALVRAGDGFLLVQPTPAAGGADASLAASLAADEQLAADGSWSALSVVEGAAAQAATVFALTAAVGGDGGVYGVLDGSAVLPPALSPPTD